MSETQENASVAMSIDDIFTKLTERVSDYNARLMIQSALIMSGMDQKTSDLNKEEAKTICLELIKKGGPAFQVGKDLYQRVQ